MPSIKGTALVMSASIARQTHGEAGLEKVLKALNEQDRANMVHPLSSEWYPLSTYVHWFQTEMKELCGGDKAMFMKRVQMGVEQQFKGIYKMFLVLGSPEKILQRLSVINNQYFQDLSVSAEILEKGKIRLVYKGLEKGQDIFELAMEAWWTKALELMGARDIKMHRDISVNDGKGFTEFLLTWSK